MVEPDAKFLLREAIEAIAGAENDMGEMEDMLPALTLYLDEFAAADFECAMRGMPPTPPAIYPGVEGVAKGWADFGEAFAGIRAELEEIREAERGLVVLVNQIATTRTGGLEISQPSAMAFLFDDAGRVGRLEFHLDQAEALRVAGVEPGPA